MDKWDTRFMNLAETISTWASCHKEHRNVGAVIVKNKRILTTGYNGAPSGIKTCKEKGFCMREKNNVPSGTKQEFCYAVHAEQNAIIQGAKLGISLDGSTLYCTHQPCSMCTRIIINSGIKKVFFKHPYPDDFSISLFSEAGVELIKYTEENNIH